MPRTKLKRKQVIRQSIYYYVPKDVENIICMYARPMNGHHVLQLLVEKESNPKIHYMDVCSIFIMTEVCNWIIQFHLTDNKYSVTKWKLESEPLYISIREMLPFFQSQCITRIELWYIGHYVHKSPIELYSTGIGFSEDVYTDFLSSC